MPPRLGPRLHRSPRQPMIRLPTGGVALKTSISPRATVLAVVDFVLLLVIAVLAWLSRDSIGLGGVAGMLLLGLLLLAATQGLLLLEARARQPLEAQLQKTRQLLERAGQDAKRIGDDMQRLAQFSEQLQSCRALEEIVEVLSVAMRGLLPQFDGALYLQAPGRNVVARQAAWGKPEHPLEDMFSPDDCWAMRRGVLYPGDGKAPACKHLGEATPPEHALCAPLKANEGTFGVLHFQGGSTPTLAERRLAQNIADQLALTVANLRLQEMLRVQQVRDPLTGLFNRRAMEASLLHECLKARRKNQTVGLLMIDLDLFKRFVDKHGHETGDVALAQVASQITQSVRQDDIVCRYGGEEFVVIMPDADADTAREQGDAIRRAVKAAHIDLNGRRLEVITVSVGVAVYPLHGAEPTLCLRAADKALNAAKEAGRDRVEVAEPVAVVAAAGNGGRPGVSAATGGAAPTGSPQTANRQG